MGNKGNWSRCLKVISCGEYILGVPHIMHVLTHNCSVNKIKRQNYAGTLILSPTDNIIIVNNVFTSTAHCYVRNVLQMYMY